jgi:predicted  nucleic acid-binding Zn-ribbon protein
MNKTKFFSSLLVVALFAAATSVFTSCKDYDDDINNLQKQIDNLSTSLKSDITSLQTSLTTELNTVKSQLSTAQQNLQAAIDKKADASTVSALETKINGFEARISGLETQLASIEEAQKQYATKGDLADLALVYATITGDIEPLKKAIEDAQGAIGAANEAAKDAADAVKQEAADRQAAIEAVQKNIEDQQKALEDLEKKLQEKIDAVAAASGDAEQVKKLVAAIEEMKTKLANYDALTKDVATLKTDMQKLSEELNKKISDQANILNVFVNKRLTSLVLMPDFYWEGIEGIEVPMVPFYLFEQTKETYKFTYTVINPTLGNQEVKVTVKNPMGFYVYDKDKKLVVYNSETKDIWDNPEREWSPASLAFGDFEFVQKNEKDVLLQDMLHPGAVAKYHVNPTTANLEGLKIDFFENDAEVYTRNGSDFVAPKAKEATFKKDGLNIYENGILSIPFDVNEENVFGMFFDWAFYNNTNTVYRSEDYPFPYNLEEAGTIHPAGNVYWTYNCYEPIWGLLQQLGAHGHGTGYNYYFWDGESDLYKETTPLPFIAAQLSSGDTVVTSDYAVLTPSIINIIALADNAAEQKINGQDTYFGTLSFCDWAVRERHLYESVGYDGADDQNSFGAIPMPATHSVAFDGSIDLSEFIETHFDYISMARYGQSAACQTMTDEMMEQLGLHYEYTIVDYTTGEETTSQSAHIEQDKANPAVFYPRSVTEDGKTITGKTATREVVGREPLIRVDLVYNNKELGIKEIIRYGYIKLRIVDQKSADMNVTINLSDIYMNCGDSAKVTWSQMENLILAKLGTNGMLKEEFEKNYYLEVAGGYENMPYINPTNGDPAGDLYTGAVAGKWWAARYYINEDGEYALAQDVDDVDDQEDLPTGDDAYKTWTADNNWFGRVWYTPHDNSTTGHNWDENTNVLVWQFDNTIAGQSNMTPDGYENMIKVVNATYKSKGLNQKELSTIVRFVNKINGTSIWVKLVLAVGKVHFAYGDINRRVLDHWYDYKQGYRDNTADTIEVYANVPTPAEVAQAPLTTTSFEKDLKEYWLGKKVIPFIYDAAHFSKFWNKGADNKLYTADDSYLGEVTFQFRLPKKGENTVDIDADKKGVWKVDGISGNTYELYLDNNNTEIWAKKNASAGMSEKELICEISADGIIKYAGRDGAGMANASKKSKGIVDPYTATADQNNVVNGAASDILNLIGMYDATGKYQKDVYLTGHAKRTFAAYIEIKVANDCYAPLIGKNYFNVRFLRPINVWPAEKKVTDALNKTEFINIWELLYIRDWRTYAVVMDKMVQKFGDKAVSGTGLDGKTYGKKDVVYFEEGNVPYSFYNITNLYVRRNEIRSDAYLEPAKRTTLTNAADIKKLYSIEEIPALTNGDTQYLKIIPKSAANDSYTAAGKGQDASFKADDVLAYTNNGGVVKPFHIYVPIAVEYPWGALRIYTQTAWAVITVDPTVGNE